MATLPDAVRSPRRGDRVIRTAEELGEDKAATIIHRLASRRSEPVKLLYTKALQPNAIFAQQYRLSPHDSSAIIPVTTAVTVTGLTEAGDVMSATYMARMRAIFNDQPETLRFAANCAIIELGDATDIFGFLGPWHLPEFNSFLRARFEEVRETKVPTTALTAARSWTRGRELMWVMLPAIATARAAEEIKAAISRMEDLRCQILRRQADGAEPDPRVLRRYNTLKLGLDAYWFFIGYQRTTEVEREPSLPAIEGASRINLMVD